MVKKIDDEKAKELRQKKRSNEYIRFQKIIGDLGEKYHITDARPAHRTQSGMVYFALDPKNYLVAIKKTPLIKLKASNPETKIEFYRRDKKKIDLLYYPEDGKDCKYIANLENYWTTEKDLFIVTEYVEHPFDDVPGMIRNEEIYTNDALNIFINLCRGLEHIHKNLVHRDIKPGNIRYDIIENAAGTKEIRPKIIDFGLACGLDTSMTVMGTPGYSAPERLRDKLGVGVDIYPMGVLLWETLTGSDPFTVKTRMDERYQTDPALRKEFEKIDDDHTLTAANKEELKRKKHIDIFLDEMEPIQDSPYLTEIVKKAMHPLQDERYQSATELKRDLQIAIYKKDMEELLSDFEKLNSLSPSIKKAILFDLDVLKSMNDKKQRFYDTLEKEFNILDTHSPYLLRFFREKIEERLAPLIDASKTYLNRLSINSLELESEKELIENYRQQIENMLLNQKPAVKKNILEMTQRLKAIYHICELNKTEY